MMTIFQLHIYLLNILLVKLDLDNQIYLQIISINFRVLIKSRMKFWVESNQFLFIFLYIH